MVSKIALTLSVLACVEAFSVVPSSSQKVSATALHMGLFDGVKDAFVAPALERSVIDAERETPIDRWMGWSVVSENGKKEQTVGRFCCSFFASRDSSIRFICTLFSYVLVSFPSVSFITLLFIAAGDFIDSMDEKNYIAVDLAKPMGIVFEENDSACGGIFVQSLKEGGIAQTHGVVKEGDQLVAVNKEKVSGMPFDDALGTIVDAEGQTTKLVLFRGTADQLYGKTGASQQWLDEFISKGGVEATPAIA